jgi:hypothetical protein
MMLHANYLSSRLTKNKKEKKVSFQWDLNPGPLA